MNKLSRTRSALDRIEKAGNALPHPTLLFVFLSLLVIVLSALFYSIGTAVIHPLNGNSISVVNLLSLDGFNRITGNMVKNFTGFAPVGPVLVVMLGIGIAEKSGLIQSLLKLLVLKAPDTLLTFIVVFAGVMSSIAVDSGYVVLIPVSGMVFLAAGRNPIAGIAASFAGVSAGFSANLLIGPVDAILGGISTEAAQLLDPGYEVAATGNYYFIIASTLLLSIAGTWVTEKFVMPSLDGSSTDNQAESVSLHLPAAERKALKYTGLLVLVIGALLVWGLVPEQGFLRNPETSSIIKSPFMSGLIAIIFLIAALCGTVYGYISGTFSNGNDIVEAMEDTMRIMATYIVLMFFAAQFVAFFSWTNLGLVLAVEGADLLKAAGFSAIPLMICFVAFCALSNLFIGSASAKWAIMAPIFVPMLMLSGISPELTQAAYRVGDSSTNIITPLMPYFALVYAFVKRYDKDAGMGTMIVLMLPYSLIFLLTWSLMLAVWIFAGWPLGPGVSTLYAG
ncbi:MAG: AbgT family transporter [Pseudomonadales bacterium]|nr:AbgT family transporter [Pseudomonadales bacterium]